MVAGRAVGREVARPSNVVPLRRGRFQWLPAAAAASLIFGLLGTGVGYRMGRDQRNEPATQIVRVVQIDTGVSRAATAEEVPAVHARDVLRFDVVPHDDAASYVAMVTCGGKIQSTESISRERAADAIGLPLGELPAGRCELVIEGVLRDGNRLSITRSAFDVVGERSVVR
jgi:hypothetical protein